MEKYKIMNMFQQVMKIKRMCVQISLFCFTVFLTGASDCWSSIK